MTWIGYQAPQLTMDSLMDADETVLDDKAAKAGAAKLAPFLDGLDAARADNPPHLTALGHSYGSVVTGHALQQASAVDDGVIFGSPGTDRVSDLNTRTVNATTQPTTARREGSSPAEAMR